MHDEYPAAWPWRVEGSSWDILAGFLLISMRASGGKENREDIPPISQDDLPRYNAPPKHRPERSWDTSATKKGRNKVSAATRIPDALSPTWRPTQVSLAKLHIPRKLSRIYPSMPPDACMSACQYETREDIPGCPLTSAFRDEGQRIRSALGSGRNYRAAEQRYR